MSPRLIESERCPHCGAELPKEKPRACPSCAGSLQKRYLAIGCLSSKPPLILLALGAWQALAPSAPPASAEPPPALHERTDGTESAARGRRVELAEPRAIGSELTSPPVLRTRCGSRGRSRG